MQFSDILVKNALFCDETEDYRTPANNVDNVYFI